MTPGIIIVAMILDALIGEPKWLWSRVPHPAVVMGGVVKFLDKRMNNGRYKRIKGTFAITLATGSAIILGIALSHLGPGIETLVVAILVAQKSLTQHVAAVGTALSKSIPQGRAAVAMIVSRDTTNMSETQIARSAIESGAENMSDGVIAPLFWALIAGVPGILAYKIVNTADSMIGYRSDKYRDFGWAAARLDDVLNLIPARITAALMFLSNAHRPDWRVFLQSARNHKSPNAGWPETAMAQILSISLAGPRVYDGQEQDFPWINPAGKKKLAPNDVAASITVLWRTWALAGICITLIAIWQFWLA